MRSRVALEKRKQEIDKLAQKGLGVTEIANRLGLTVTVVSRIRMGKLGRKATPSKSIRKIWKYYDQGLSQAEIARLMNCSRQYIHSVVKKTASQML
jgi:DNA-binding transcriptional regulator LsrR (DeoR family)